MIERFTKEQFENALPVDKKTGNPLWERVGDGERGDGVLGAG